MSRWIDIDDISLLKTVSVGGLSAKALWKRIRQEPSIDLVRCGECKHAHLTYDGECKYCDIWFPDEACYLKGSDFCSYGERKENE